MYGNKEAVTAIFSAMKDSSMAENIAGEIPYLADLFELLNSHYEDALLTIDYIINGLGEILSPALVLDFELKEVFENLIAAEPDSKIAAVLLNAYEKFETLTENDEYLFDEDKETKNEIHNIKKIVSGINKKQLTICSENKSKCQTHKVWHFFCLLSDRI